MKQAIDDGDPLPPWVGVSTTDEWGDDHVAPDIAHDMAYRIGRHAGTITADVARAAMDELGELPYVELCAIASTVGAVVHFCRNVGIDVPVFPEPAEGEPTQELPELAMPEMNWVPVAVPADEAPAVVQAYTAVPAELENTWRMGGAQYMPPAEMIQHDWMRRADGLTRAQSELVAARVAQLRECFY